MAIWRLNTDGSLDTTFDSDGYFVQHNAAGGNGDDYGYAVMIQNDGRVIVTGKSYNGSDDDMAIWRVWP